MATHTSREQEVRTVVLDVEDTADVGSLLDYSDLRTDT